MKFGQYELLERVAVGGMAEVYRGRVAGAEGFEKPVAIKRILPEYARDERFISMMLTEARIHSALSHRNIVQIHDLGISESGEYFIVLEYVEGHDLRAVMEAATDLGVQIPDSLALHVADELAQALHFAHELTGPDGQPLGIIHRDVSPSNVLITNSGEVKLSDFGIAKRRHDHSFVGSLKGNLVYMSPEQAQRVPLDRRTDVFSLGAVLFEMLTGHKLREITDEVNGFREVASGAVRSARALRPDLPESYEALLNRALAANPADRFPDAAAFGAAIRELRRENDAPVGPADMKELIELLNPPRRARSPVERSKVIRLGPEFKVLSGAQRPRPLTAPPAAPAPAAAAVPPRGPEAPVGVATPVVPPGLVAADMITPKGNGSGNGSGNGNGNAKRVWTDARLSAPTPEPAFSMPPTPPPPVIAPPPFVRTAPPMNGAGASDPQATPPPPTPPARGDVATPVAALSTRTRPFGSAILAQLRPSDGTASDDPASAMLTPPPSPGAFGPQSIPRAPSGPITATGWSAPPPLEGGPLTPAVGALRIDAPSARFVMPAAAAFAAADPVVPRRGRGRSKLLLFLVLVLVAAGAGAAVVHFKVMPLKVALVWLKPATLAVTSEPPGATVKLDGRELPAKTPLRTEVKRDRVEHTLEFTRAGSLPARATMRFDRSVPLDQSVTLEAEPPPPPPAEPPPEPAVAAESPPPVEAKVETKTDTETETEPTETTAETKAAKRAAAKQAKLEAKRDAKAAKKAKESKDSKKAKKSKKAKAGHTKAVKAKASAEPGSDL